MGGDDDDEEYIHEVVEFMDMVWIDDDDSAESDSDSTDSQDVIKDDNDNSFGLVS